MLCSAASKLTHGHASQVSVDKTVAACLGRTKVACTTSWLLVKSVVFDTERPDLCAPNAILYFPVWSHHSICKLSFQIVFDLLPPRLWTAYLVKEVCLKVSTAVVYFKAEELPCAAVTKRCAVPWPVVAWCADRHDPHLRCERLDSPFLSRATDCRPQPPTLFRNSCSATFLQVRTQVPITRIWSKDLLPTN